MSRIKLYNSLAREKQVFEPIDPAHIRVYACGPTVYDYAHIGNARAAVVFDLWASVLRTVYPKVTYASNITDVEDKIMDAAKKAGVPIAEITEKFTNIYNDDMAALGVNHPDVQPKATEHIAEMIKIIEDLIERGHAYEAKGHVLFNVPSDSSYGILSGRSRDEQIAGARVEVSPFKKDPADFVLWKPSDADQPGWDSPWGFGRPGWHIECSAMAEKHLGLPFDIHGGGADLKFPHHENEIAQSCCAHGTESDVTSFAKYWVHNGFVTVDGEKMSKSLGNFLVAKDLLEKYDGAVLRMALLSAHYRQPLDWNDQVVHQAGVLVKKTGDLLQELESIEAKDEPYGDFLQKFTDALYDDLNVPLALSELNAVLSSIRKDIHAGKDENLSSQKFQLLKMMELIGLKITAKKESLVGIDAAEIESLLQKRQDAKKAKDFALADSIRADLDARGVVIEDTAQGPKWKKK